MDDTSKIESLNLEVLEKHRSPIHKQTQSVTQDELEYLLRCFQILLYFPSDILKATIARPLARRAILLDLFSTSLPSGPSDTPISFDVLRLFASRRVYDDTPLLKDFVSRTLILYMSLDVSDITPVTPVDGPQDRDCTRYPKVK